MARKPWLPGLAVFALTAMAATAQAGVVGGSARELATVGMTGSDLQQIANRVCWRENGIRRCRSLNNVHGYRAPRTSRYRAPAVGYGYQAPAFYGVGPPIGLGGFGYRDQIEIDPNAFPVGSEGWWNSMDALDRGGQGNGQ